MRSLLIALLPLLALVTINAFAVDEWPIPQVDSEQFRGEKVVPDQVMIDKSERRIYLYRAGTAYASYKMKLGGNPKGHKVKQGDKRTPEGDYFFDWHHLNSKYTKAIHISYPNAEDRARAESLGVNPGGSIFLHGMPSKFGSWGIFKKLAEKIMSVFDWTNGCIAVKNKYIDRLYDEIQDGTPVHIQK